jgi:hypothetical protein
VPTLNWILEAAEDRYLEATDLPPAPALVVELSCPFCARFFAGEDSSELAKDVARHIARDHPLKRPVLVVDGRVLGSNSTIARLPASPQIAIENTTEIEARVDGGDPHHVSREEAHGLLTEQPKRMLHLRLVNGRSEDNAAAAVEYRIKIDIADADELNSVDDAFLRHLAREDPTRADVMRFSDETDGMANFYRDGLVSYVLGVFAKDHTDESDPHLLERGLESLGRSAHHLASFLDRKVGAAVAACARFNLNEMTPFEANTGITAVDVVSRFLLLLSRGEEHVAWPTRPTATPSQFRCPVDEATYSLLELTFELDGASSETLLTEQIDRIDRGRLTSPDRAKLAVVVGEWADRNGSADIASRCATTLYNDAVFEAVTKRWGAA